MAVNNIQKFHLTTDSPPEKVIYKLPASILVNIHPSHSDAQLFTYAHGLGFAPLCRGSYRFSNIAGSIGWSPIDTGGPISSSFGTSVTWQPALQTAVFSDETNVYFYAWNQTPFVCNVDVRVFGVTDPIVVNTKLPSQNTLNDGYIFNTDDNYLKIFRRGSGNVMSTPGSPQVVTANHGLGYKPVAFTWVYSPATGFWGASGTENHVGVTSFESSAIITNQDLVITFTSFGAIAGTPKYAYRIFADE